MKKKIGDLTLREIVNTQGELIKAFCNKFGDYEKSSCTCCPMLSDSDTCIFDDLGNNKSYMMDEEIEVEDNEK